MSKIDKIDYLEKFCANENDCEKCVIRKVFPDCLDNDWNTMTYEEINRCYEAARDNMRGKNKCIDCSFYECEAHNFPCIDCVNCLGENNYFKQMRETTGKVNHCDTEKSNEDSHNCTQKVTPKTSPSMSLNDALINVAISCLKTYLDNGDIRDIKLAMHCIKRRIEIISDKSQETI